MSTNLGNYIKLLIFLYEKIHLQMNVLNDNEKKLNQGIINGNIYFWIVHNLERTNSALYVY